MCGFTLVQGSDVDSASVESSADRLSHRGPDERNVEFETGMRVGMSHCRLSIIDVTDGKQPMKKGSTTLLFNGEIYNYVELREELRSAGRNFTTESDTEVLLEAYREWGEECLRHLRGMFSFCVVDEPRGRLFLARDRFGQKPLYYAEGSDRFVASSEVQGVLPFLSGSRTLDPRALHLYLGLQYVPSPRTGFREVREVHPAQSMVVEDGVVRDRNRYWSLNYEPKSEGTFGEAARRVRESLRESVRLRMRSDVPLGAFLSGGLDSSTVVALMSELSDRPVKTVSIGFDYEEHDEREYARAVAERFNTDHHEFTVTPDVRELLPELVQHYGEPFADSSAIPVYYVSREARREVKVALTGDGGDELLGGYGLYQKMALRQTLRSYLPGPLGDLAGWIGNKLPYDEEGRGLLNKGVLTLKHLQGSPGEWYYFLASYFTVDQLERLYRGSKGNASAAREFCRRAFDDYEHLDSDAEKAMAYEVERYLPDDLLFKVDVASMMNSLECRSPFLDHHFAETVARLPLEYKLGRGEEGKKRILREAFRDVLPESVLQHRKMGFGIPRDEWLRNELSDYLPDVLFSGGSGLWTVLDRDYVETLHEEHVSGRGDYGDQLWALLMLRLWMDRFDVSIP